MIEFPSFRDLFNTYSAKLKEQIPSIDPTILSSWALAFGRGCSASAYSIVILCKELLRQFNPITATGEFLELWASYDGLTRIEESPSLGVIRVYGVDGTAIPANEEWVSDTNGLLYANAASSSIGPQDTDTPAIALSQLTFSGTTITASSFVQHGLKVGDFIRIEGAIEPEYNGIQEITVILNDFQFEYEVSVPPPNNATGGPFTATPIIAIEEISGNGVIATVTTPAPHQLVTGQYVVIGETGFPSYDGIFEITVTSDTEFTYPLLDNPPTSAQGVINSIHANVTIQSEVTGPQTVLGVDSLFTYQGSTVGINPSAKTLEGIQGGTNTETDEQLKSRMLLSRSSQEGVFTNDQITLAALLIAGNTRVFIQNPDTEQVGDPDAVLPGQVRVYFLRDNDPLGPLPTGSIIALTKQSIIDNGRLPAEMWADDLQVRSPELLPVDITMTNVVPNTATMRTAIKDQFNAYFTDEASFGIDLDNDVLRGVVIGTQDLSSGNPEESFIISFDWVDAVETVGKNQLPVLGTLTVNGTEV